MKLIYAGTFDPITLGHLDVIKRASAIGGEVVVAILNNIAKKPLFTVDERLEMIRHEVSSMANVRVRAYDGLLAELAREEGAVIVRGLRSGADLEAELPVSQANYSIYGAETIFLGSAPELSFVSSSIVREVASFHGDISGLVSAYVREKVEERINKK